MSKEEIIRCMQDALDKKLTPTNDDADIETFVTAMNEQGYDFTVQDVKEVDAFIAKQPLGDDELETVTGGLSPSWVVLFSMGTALCATKYIISKALGLPTKSHEKGMRTYTKELEREFKGRG